MKLTKTQLEILYQMVNAHIKWNVGGCFGDGEEIIDQKGLTTAKKILEKINNELEILTK